LQLYFLPSPHPVFFFLAYETFPTHPPTTPHCLPPTYSPIYLNWKWTLPHLPTRPTTNLPTNTLSRYLPNPTYLVTPTYMVATTIDPQRSKTMRKE
jgi:hypothetical protein